jgi:hypothetical protein
MRALLARSRSASGGVESTTRARRHGDTRPGPLSLSDAHLGSSRPCPAVRGTQVYVAQAHRPADATRRSSRTSGTGRSAVSAGNALRTSSRTARWPCLADISEASGRRSVDVSDYQRSRSGTSRSVCRSATGGITRKRQRAARMSSTSRQPRLSGQSVQGGRSDLGGVETERPRRRAAARPVLA